MKVVDEGTFVSGSPFGEVSFSGETMHMGIQIGKMRESMKDTNDSRNEGTVKFCRVKINITGSQYPQI